MRTAIAAFTAALLTLTIAVPMAGAAPTEVRVRIEGKTQTLFEGPILTDGHQIRASSDAKSRPCDGTNNGAHPAPGPTPTAASVDAMAIAGESFDGKWYPGYDDYFITRWGPDAEGGDAFWGILVNGSFTSLGGCQFAAQAGNEVLWAFDAFNSRPLLRLATAADPSSPPGPASPAASVEQGHPLSLSVKSYTGAMDGAPESIQPAGGVLIAPVATDPVKGYQEAKTTDPATVTTVADGTVPITFSDPGWHRLKATKVGYVRSNRLDVCVEPSGGGSCGPLPADAQLRTPPAQQLPADPHDPSKPSSSIGGGPSNSLTGDPPAPPGNFSFGRVRTNVRTGTAVLAVSIPGPGRLTVSGGKVREQSAWGSAPGTVRLGVKARGRALERLRRTGRMRVSVTVAFDPVGGMTRTASRNVVLKLEEAAG